MSEKNIKSKVTRIKKENRLQKTIDYIKRKYQFRYNQVLHLPEFKKKTEEKYKMLDSRELNTLLLDYNLDPENNNRLITDARFRQFLNSNYVKVYNPFKEYYKNLNAWNQEADYIKIFCEAIETKENSGFFYNIIKKWLVGVIAQSLGRGKNEICPILTGRQGIGKTSILNALVPRQLERYHNTTRIDFKSKDRFYYLISSFFIQLDEIDQYRENEIAGLKDILSQEKVLYRPLYSNYLEFCSRTASFFGTTNTTEHLVDYTGSRRYPGITIKSIDWGKINKIDINLMYAQAYYLYNKNFKYWLTKTEENEIEINNKNYLTTTPAQDLISKYLELPQDVTKIKRLTTTDVAIYIQQKSGILLGNKQLGSFLFMAGFKKKTVSGGTKRWEVEIKNDAERI